MAENMKERLSLRRDNRGDDSGEDRQVLSAYQIMDYAHLRI